MVSVMFNHVGERFGRLVVVAQDKYIKNTGEMFSYCQLFNQDISAWDVSNVINMEAMFYRCTNFNQDISSWDVSNVKSMDYMFNSCKIEEKYKPKFK